MVFFSYKNHRRNVSRLSKFIESEIDEEIVSKKLDSYRLRQCNII
jgi:hypothetical protein